MTTRTDDCIQFMEALKEAVPPAVYAFVDAHDFHLAEDRTQAVYSCNTEEAHFVLDEDEQALEFIRYAISWAKYVQDFGDYETREEFHHGTPEEWEFEVKKSNEWISLLTVWRESLKEVSA